MSLRRSRAWPRLYVMAAAGLRLPLQRARPVEVRRLLIVQHFLLGDTIMLTPLLKKARERFLDAEIIMVCPRPYAAIYSKRPYGVEVLPFEARSLGDHIALRKRRGFDLALVPGDNRWSWLARALDSRWIVAFAPDQRRYHDWPVDEHRPLPREPMTWGDMATRLIDGPDPEPYRNGEWPAPHFAPYDRPRRRYCVFHLGASSPHKLWPVERWREVLKWAEARAYEVVLTVGPGEQALAAALDPQGRRSALAGRLDLAQIWDLLSHAEFLLCPDTGIAHLARLVGVPTIALYGPGSPISTGPGRFWAQSRLRALWDPNVACRDQDRLFERRVEWLRQCWRGVAECGDPICIRRIDVPQVTAAIEELLA
ncbi:MAG: glycosyltransferase family 9 protein [Burkholderiales bacterium]